MRTALVTTALWAGFGVLGLACPICFQAEPGPVSDGVRAAVIVLIGVTSCVLGGFAVFVRRLATTSDPTSDPVLWKTPPTPTPPTPTPPTPAVENTSDPITSDPIAYVSSRR